MSRLISAQDLHCNTVILDAAQILDDDWHVLSEEGYAYPDRRWPDREYWVGWACQTPDGRWWLVGGHGWDRWYGPMLPSAKEKGFLKPTYVHRDWIEATPADVAALCIRLDRELPTALAEIVGKTDGTTRLNGEPTPAAAVATTSEAIEPAAKTPATEGTKVAIDYTAIANELSKKSKALQAKLVEYMADRESADEEDIAKEVHGDNETLKDAMRQNAKRTTDSVREFEPRLSYQLAGGKMHKQISPE
jgi:hypothetical protein